MLFRLQELTRTGYVELSFFSSSTTCKLNSLLARPLRPYSLSCTWQLLYLEDEVLYSSCCANAALAKLHLLFTSLSVSLLSNVSSCAFSPGKENRIAGTRPTCAAELH